MKTLNDWRSDIDRIDSEILRLLSRRTEIAIEVGKLKRTSGDPISSPERENLVLARVIAQNSGPLNVHSIQRIFRLIIRETRRAEQNAAAEPLMSEGGSRD
jgi:chorismate mutase / prephenate dehydratase